MIKTRIISLLAAISMTSLGGCAAWNSLTPQQQVTLVATYVNGACVLVATGSQAAMSIDSIVNTNDVTTQGTITKVAQISAVACSTLNGVVATVTTAGTVQVPTAVTAKLKRK